MYRESGAELPESAAQVRRTDAGNDPTFARIHEHGDRMDQNNAYETAYDLMHQEETKKTAANRREILSKSYGPNRMDPTIEAAHLELVEAGVHHYMPKIRTLPPKAMFTKPHPAMVVMGQPQAPEFPSFEFLNMGQPANIRAATVSLSQNSTCERIRDFVVQPTFSS